MPDMPTPNPDGAYSSNLPEYESMPDLGGRGDGEYKSENFDADRVWVSGRKAADDRGDYEFQWAMFNRFRLDTNTPRQTEWRTEELDPPVWRTVELGDGMCQQQRQATDKEFTFKYAILLQYYEQWNTNVDLEEYYETLGNPITGAAGVGMKLGGLFGALKYNAAATAIETGAAASTTGTVTGSAAAAGSASVVAVGVGTFLATTAVMSRIKKATTVGVTGWQPVGRVKIEERETGNTRQSWVDVGEPYPCPRKRPTTGTPPPPVGRVGGDPQIVPRPDPDAGRRSLNLWWWLGFLLVLLLITVIAVVLFTGGDEAAVVATREPATEAVTDSVGEPGEGSADEGTAGEPSDAVPSDEPAPEPAFELVVPPGYEALASLMALSGFSDMQIGFVLGQAEDDG
ncbi:MAG: hypothetical protein ACE5GB_07150, partial [Acidimicrobiales bacterium]